MDGSIQPGWSFSTFTGNQQVNAMVTSWHMFLDRFQYFAPLRPCCAVLTAIEVSHHHHRGIKHVLGKQSQRMTPDGPASRRPWQV